MLRGWDPLQEEGGCVPTALAEPVLTCKAVPSQTPPVPSAKPPLGPARTTPPAGERDGVREPSSLPLASQTGPSQRARSDAARYKPSKETVSSRTRFLETSISSQTSSSRRVLLPEAIPKDSAPGSSPLPNTQAGSPSSLGTGQQRHGCSYPVLFLFPPSWAKKRKQVHHF